LERNLCASGVPCHNFLGTVGRMDISPRHRDAESRFLTLVSDAGLDPPDAVTYGAESVTFFWTEPKVAVVVDLDDAVSPLVLDAPVSSRPGG
jgi:hypothetical protein